MKSVNRTKKLISVFTICAVIPAAILGGAVIFHGRVYAWVSLCVTVLACLPFFLSFERKEADSKRLILVAAMAALSVVGRIAFAPIPAFKPVAALVVVTAMYFGCEAGFMTGALSAVVSNFYFGQGAWTPFQMFSWGMIGFFAGVLARSLKKSRIALCVYGAVSGVAFSLIMDLWTTLWADGKFNPERYAAAVITAIPFVIVYAVSNVIFLLLFSGFLGKVFERLKSKYLL